MFRSSIITMYVIQKSRNRDNMSKWLLVRKGADYNKIGERFNIDPLIARLIVNRGVNTIEDIDAYLNGTSDSFYDPHLMKDMDKAAQILFQKIDEGKHIRVIGDYDGDGVSATTILVKGLRTLSANVDAVIPHRIRDGYGLNIRLIDDALADGVDTILTCDNGISAREEIAYAKEHDMTVVVTDHHDIPFTDEEDGRKFLIPNADAVVDPKQEDCCYPFSNICGAFVAYKLMQVMFNGKYQDVLDELMLYAAFATVTDIMELTGENRILVKLGLKAMKDTKAKGLRALIDVNGLRGQELTFYSLGFVLGPCINAAGRMDSADKALDLFLAESQPEAMTLAGDLKSMNDSRKIYTERGTKQACEIIENSDMKDQKVLVVFLPDCIESVAGIVAGRIKEKYYKPTLVITKAEDGAKGSGRSIESYDMYEALTRVADVFTKFGGHSQAAGFSLPTEKIDELRMRLNMDCELTDDDMQEVVRIDADTPFSYCNGKVVDQLALLEPCGNGNAKPLFARRNLELVSGKIYSEGKVGKYGVRDEDGKVYELTLFSKNYEFKEFLDKKYGSGTADLVLSGRAKNVFIHAAYEPKWNEFRGVKTVQFIMEDYC